MRYYFVLMLVIFPLQTVAEIGPGERIMIEGIIKTIKTGKKDEIADLFSYPIHMIYPNPDILSKNEFKERYAEVFDEKITNEIGTSTVSDNWHSVGWRGIMFNDGSVWVDYDGKINKVNYITEKQSDKLKNIISRQKKSIHPSLREFMTPVLEWNIGRFHIRVDQMEDYSYRYASWSRTKDISKQPDIILKRGVAETYGSGGNHAYIFENGPYLYRVSRYLIGAEDTPPGRLQVFRNKETILSLDLQ